jgi:hypothetical protein
LGSPGLAGPGVKKPVDQHENVLIDGPFLDGGG